MGPVGRLLPWLRIPPMLRAIRSGGLAAHGRLRLGNADDHELSRFDRHDADQHDKLAQVQVIRRHGYAEIALYEESVFGACAEEGSVAPRLRQETAHTLAHTRPQA